MPRFQFEVRRVLHFTVEGGLENTQQKKIHNPALHTAMSIGHNKMKTLKPKNLTCTLGQGCPLGCHEPRRKTAPVVGDIALKIKYSGQYFTPHMDRSCTQVIRIANAGGNSPRAKFQNN